MVKHLSDGAWNGPIIDAHHHLWDGSPTPSFDPYNAEALCHDIAESGHNIVATVYVDSHFDFLRAFR